MTSTFTFIMVSTLTLIMASTSIMASALSFSSLPELEDCLLHFHIDSNLWNGVKPSNLLADIQKGESVLEIEEDQLYRRVNVVSVYCYFTNDNNEKMRLVEEKQIMPDGKMRLRGYTFVSETMKKGESPQQAARRGLAEELQISDPELQFEVLNDEKITKESTTFVGINTHYLIHYLKTEIPLRHFKEHYVEMENGVETHFKWERV